MLGFLLDLLLGDPSFFLHPIRLIGSLIAALEGILRKIFKGKYGLLLAGGLMTLLVCLICGGICYWLLRLAYGCSTYLGLMAESLVCYFTLAARSLRDESMKVYNCLKGEDIQGAKKAVSMIVGRDTEGLSKEGIIKAAVETVAENLSDGVIAPLFYMFIGGGCLSLLYKAVNTMDSMTGYKNEKYIYFGRVPARLDDLVNFIPARLAAVFLLAAALICGQDYKNAIRIFLRDRYKHSSPNSAQTESVCAGALRVQLAGDAFYFGKLYKKPFIGDDIRDVETEDIRTANNMMYGAAFVGFLVFLFLKILLIRLMG